MQRAMDETARRREKQQQYNELHQITPRTVQKKIMDVMEGARAKERKGRVRMVPTKPSTQLTSEALMKQIALLEKTMFEHAENMEFERAAEVRDELLALKELLKT